MNSKPTYTLEELLAKVNAWAETQNLAPANGQSAEHLSLRTLRYYRTLGLIAAPLFNAKRGYGDLHRLQLCAIRVLQAQGLPLNRIQTLLYGRSESDLQKILTRGLAATPVPTPSLPPLLQAEDWRVFPLDDCALLVLRHGRSLTPEQISTIQSILKGTHVLPTT